MLGYSSQRSPTQSSAAQALGAPDTTAYGDQPSAWSPAVMNGSTETITLGYTTPVYATGVTIRETSGNGFVRRIDVQDTNDVLHTVWSGSDTAPPGAPADFAINFARTPYLVKAVMVQVDTDHDPGAWEQIDAVQLRGETILNQLVWTGAGDGVSWANPLNWSAYRLPTALDDVVIGAGANVALAAGTAATVKSLNCAGALTVNGSLSLQSDSSATGLFKNYGSLTVQDGATFTLSGGGALGGTVNLANTGALVLAAGTFVAPNNAQVAGGGTLVVGMGGDATLNVAAGQTTVQANLELRTGGTVGGAGTLSVTRRLSWTGGAMADGGLTRIAAGAALTIDGVARSTNRTIENRGAASLLAGRRLVLSNSFFDKRGNFDVVGTAWVDWNVNAGVAPTFLNRGTFTKKGPGDVEVRAIFNNQGYVDIQQGELALYANGLYTGQFNVRGGTTLTLANAANPATHNFAAGSSIVGPGLVVFGGGDQNQLLIAAGHQLRMENFRFEGTGSIVGGTISARSFNWDVGDIRDSQVSVRKGDVLRIGAAGSCRLYNSQILNLGTAEWVGEFDMTLFDGSLIRNDGSDLEGLFIIRNGQSLLSRASERYVGPESTLVLLNGGVLRKEGGGETTIDALVQNTGGVLDLQGRDITLDADYSPSGATTRIGNGGNLTVQGNYNQTGATGQTLLDGGTLTADNVQLFAGRISLGGGTIFVAAAGVIVNNGGTITGGGLLSGNVTNAGTLELSEAGTTGELRIAGDFTQTAAGSLRVNVAGPAAGAFDRLHVVGNVTLGGVVSVALVGNPPLNPGVDRFAFLTYTGARMGNFGPVLPQGGAGAYTWTLAYNANNVELRI